MKQLILILSLIATNASAQVSIGKAPPQVVIKGDDGGRTDGSAWDSSMIKGKVMSLFYVDPDEKDSNEILESALGKEEFPKDKYQSIGIINMDATWMPNFAIASALASKQEKYPDVIYVKDMKKVLVNKWGLKDDAYVVLIFNKAGELIHQDSGVLDKARTAAVVKKIKDNL